MSQSTRKPNWILTFPNTGTGLAVIQKKATDNTTKVKESSPITLVVINLWRLITGPVTSFFIKLRNEILIKRNNQKQNIQQAIDQLKKAREKGKLPGEIKLNGSLHGACTCIEFAQAVYKEFGHDIKININITDPTPGVGGIIESKMIVPPNVELLNINYSTEKNATHLPFLTPLKIDEFCLGSEETTVKINSEEPLKRQFNLTPSNNEEKDKYIKNKEVKLREKLEDIKIKNKALTELDSKDPICNEKKENLEEEKLWELVIRSELAKARQYELDSCYKHWQCKKIIDEAKISMLPDEKDKVDKLKDKLFKKIEWNYDRFVFLNIELASLEKSLPLPNNLIKLIKDLKTVYEQDKYEQNEIIKRDRKRDRKRDIDTTSTPAIHVSANLKTQTEPAEYNTPRRVSKFLENNPGARGNTANSVDQAPSVSPTPPTLSSPRSSTGTSTSSTPGENTIDTTKDEPTSASTPTTPTLSRHRIGGKPT